MCFEFIFSGDLYHARKRRGWSQQKVAEMVAISVREYQNIERGRVTPHLKTFLDVYKRQVLRSLLRR